jgi:inorganic pyrophosphatase
MYSLSKILPLGMAFPYDFGFVPGTKAEDGDPLDVLVLTDKPLFPGCLVESRVIGVIELAQEAAGKKERNDRLIAVAQASLLYAEAKDLPGPQWGSNEASRGVFRQLSKSPRYHRDHSRPVRPRPGAADFASQPQQEQIRYLSWA